MLPSLQCVITAGSRNFPIGFARIAATMLAGKWSRRKRRNSSMPDSETRTAPRIAVDAMGGDDAPGIIVRGSLDALREKNACEVLLIGDQSAIESEIRGAHSDGLSYKIVHAPEKVEMAEAAAVSVRKKRQSSIAVATRLQKSGEVDALVSAGNTGAVVAAALLGLGRLPHVSRPAIATVVPNSQGGCVLLDAGANADCKPEHLVQFGFMGAVYARRVLEKSDPRVGLLNIGEESSKGNELAQEAHKLLRKSCLNFIGNVEGRDVFRGTADVVVCDGFTGNVVLKFAESVNDHLTGALKREMKRDLKARLGAQLLKPALEKMKSALDYAEYGGAPLLGGNGICIICHGDSSRKAIKNAVLVAKRLVNQDLNSHIERELIQSNGAVRSGN